MPSLQPTRRKVLGRWRRWFFHLWTGLTIAALAFIAILDPVVLSGDLSKLAVAAFVPPLMILLTLFGVGWLVLLVLSRGRRNDHR
jgi:hypothetical protein